MASYNHPYTPYDIQIQLMDAIYDTIDKDYKIGLFESPTGTGKTLSIICSTMTWLRNYKSGHREQSLNDPEDSESDDEPEWVKDAYQKSIVAQAKDVASAYEKHLDSLHSSSRAPVRAIGKKKRLKTELEDNYVPDDYYSDSEITTVEEQNSRLALEIKRLQGRVAGDTGPELPKQPFSIYFSSRTHSQLNQFAHQLRLTSFESSIDVPERTKFLPLGSRKQLCINQKVSKLSSITAINDACVDLQKKKDHSCDYYPKPNDTNSIETVKQFTDESFVSVSDIEDLGALGGRLRVCPYYSVRNSVDLAEVIALPYQMLLLRSAREATGIDIEDAIVIFDEAHNLIDTITAMNSVSISSAELLMAIKSLKVYLSKFSRRLNSGNRIYIVKFIKLCQVIHKYLASGEAHKPGDIINPLDIFQGTTGDMINVHKLEQFLAKSKIAYKIETYMDSIETDNYKRSSSNPILFKITQFLKCLSNTSGEGQFVWEKQDDQNSLNYILLDPSVVFDEIVSKAKCVLLCGGTMEPMDDYTSYLFPKVPQDKIKKFSCGHLIPKENLKVFPIGKMGTQSFEFQFDKRERESMIAQLGQLHLDLIAKIPAGVVVFFPSYKYLNKVLDIWTSLKILDKIKTQKEIFREPTDSLGIEATLVEYSQCIKNTKGAIIFSVVGGKMSEGINFTDDLARGVVVIGLPFPNAFSAELTAKRNFIVNTCIQKGRTKAQGMEAARHFYENICMRAVNQSVGRSIRHANDYSTIFLIDARYEGAHIQSKLSEWVRSSISKPAVTVHEVIKQTADFFEAKALS